MKGTNFPQSLGKTMATGCYAAGALLSNYMHLLDNMFYLGACVGKWVHCTIIFHAATCIGCCVRSSIKAFAFVRCCCVGIAS